MWKNRTVFLENVRQQNKLLNFLNCLFPQWERNTHTEKIDPFWTSLTRQCCTHRAFVSSTKAKQRHTQEQGYTEMGYLWWWRKSFRKLPGSRGPGEWQTRQTSGICSHLQPHIHSGVFPCGRVASAEILSKFCLSLNWSQWILKEKFTKANWNTKTPASFLRSPRRTVH